MAKNVFIAVVLVTEISMELIMIELSKMASLVIFLIQITEKLQT